MESTKDLERTLQDNLLARKASILKSRPQKLPKLYRVLYTFSLYATFVIFGLCRGLYGPTLGELQCITGAHLSQISSTFTWAGIGGMVGSLAWGVLFDRLPSLPLFTLAHLSLCALTAAIPWCTSLPLMMTMVGAQAFMYMGLAVGCNVVVLRLWRHRSSPALLGMHVLFTVGCFLAPVISEPFLSETSTGQAQISSALNETYQMVATDIQDTGAGAWDPLRSDNTNQTGFAISEAQKGIPMDDFARLEMCESHVYKAYAIISCLSLMVAIYNIFIYMNYKDCQVSPSEDVVVGYSELKRVTWIKYLSWFLFCLLNFCFGGAENILMGLLFTFGNVHAGLNKLDASRLVAGTFAAFGAGRLFALFLANCIHVRIIITVYFLLTFAASVVFAYYVTSNTLLLWICIVIIFIGIGPMFGSVLVWARDYLTVTGRFTSTYVLAYTAGMMTWPLLTGNLLQTSGPHWFPYIVTGLLSACVCICAVLWILHCNFKHNVDDDEKMLDIKIQKEKNTDMFASMRSLQAI